MEKIKMPLITVDAIKPGSGEASLDTAGLLLYAVSFI